MALRDFIDSDGTRWTAWDIPPVRAFHPQRAGAERRVAPAVARTPERRSGDDRRKRQIPPQLLHGWVCFESEAEKRRLVPPPPGWADASHAELEGYCRQARPQPKVRLD